MGLFFTAVAFAQFQENIIGSEDDTTVSSVVLKNVSLAGSISGTGEGPYLIQNGPSENVPTSAASQSRFAHFSDSVPYSRFARLKPPPFAS